MESESPGGGGGGTLLVLEPKSLRSFTTNDEYLFAMKEDLADWFACLYKMQIEADNFLTILETGVILCRHANEVQHFFKEWRQQGVTLAMRSYFIRTVPEGHVTFRTDVKPGTFQARDNVSNFITWCRNLGIPDVLRFETDDLVLRKNEKSVILCLLEVARVGAKLGMLAPTLVQMEQEIDEELESAESGKPPPQIKTCDLKSFDELVRELVGQCTCPVQFPMVKVGDGKYQIGDSRTLIFVRVLRNHVMVRVGGGWDTLENYLNKHDPCRCHFRGHRSGPTAGPAAPKHQILRRASTSALTATRTASPSPSPNHPPTSPRRMSVAATVSSPGSKGSNPGPGTFSKGPSPARSASPTPAAFRKAGSPLRSASPGPGPNGVRRLPSPSPSFYTPRESRESSVGRSSASGSLPSRPSSPALGTSLKQSQESPRPQQQRSQPSVPQHQAVQRCKSPSPAPNSRCVSPALSGNRTLPRPVSRGASGIPRPQSPAASSGSASARRQLFVSRSISFDAQRRISASEGAISRSSEELDSMADLDAADTGQEQTQVRDPSDKDISIDQISTMTLTEFKQLISNNLSVPPPDTSGDGTLDSPRGREQSRDLMGQMKRSSSVDGQNLLWSSVRDKAKSVCNSIASSVSSRRSSAGGSAGNIIARRNLPKAPASDAGRPKTPSSQTDRPKTPSGVGGERPKTPVSYRPKTPVTSAYAYRPKTPTASAGEGAPCRPPTPTRPKTPTAVGGAPRVSASSAVNSRKSDRVRPKTPTRHCERPAVVRPKTSASQNSLAQVANPRVQTTTVISTADCVTSNPRVKSSSFVYVDESDTASVENSDLEGRHPSGLGFRSASFASSVDNEESSVSLSLPQSRRSPSPDDIDGDCSEIADVMDGRNAPPSMSVRERPSTPSRIPKPSFAPRPATPSSLDSTHPKPTSASKPSGGQPVQRTLPRPSTPVGRSSAESQLSLGGGQEKTTATPRRASLTAHSNTSSSNKSYTEMFYARRAQTPGPASNSSSSSSTVSTARATTPGPSSSSGGPKGQTLANARRGSLGKTVEMSKLRKAKSVTNLLQETGRMSTVEISAAGEQKGRRASVTPRTTTTDSQQKLQRQNACEAGGNVLMVTRSKQGQHSIQVTDQHKNVTYTSGSRGRLQQSASLDSERVRSKTPGPGVGSRYQPRGIIRKPNQPPTPGQKGSGTQSKPVNRTEAWVDSTLHDPKRKQLPSRPRRPMTPNSLSVADSELLSRPLEEIQAALPSPANGLPTPDPEVIEAPPEDPEMYKKMEQLFEKYREMELRASVCDTPGGGGHHGYDNVSRSSGSHRGSVEGQGQPAYSQSSRSSSSLRTGITNSASFSSGISSGLSLQTESSRGNGANNDHFSKETSPAAAAANGPSLYNGAASNNGDCYELNATDDSACVSVTPRQDHQGAPAVSADDIVDVDEKTLSSDPSALVSKIKEILQVRPRKEDSTKTGSRSRIPAPAFLSRSRRSKSVSNIVQESSLFVEPTSISARDTVPNGVDVTRDESTNSDVSSDYSRCETPVPKMAQPLTTGRSTLFRRERSVGGGRSMSQDEQASSSSSLSSSSRRYFWDEDGEFV